MEFFIDFLPGVDSDSDNNEYQEYFLGVKAAGAYDLPPSCADYIEIWEPQTPGSLTACPGLYR
jgi:flavodoxin